MLLQNDDGNTIDGTRKKQGCLIKTGAYIGIRCRQLKYLGHVIGKKGLDILAVTGYIESEINRVTYLTSLGEWGDNKEALRDIT